MLIIAASCAAEGQWLDAYSADRRDGAVETVLDTAVEAAERPCELLSQLGCPRPGDGCFPDEARSGATRCEHAQAEAGFDTLIPCFIEAEATTCPKLQICVPPDGNGGSPSGVCVSLCPLNATGPVCDAPSGAAAATCVPLAGYPGVGYCGKPG